MQTDPSFAWRSLPGAANTIWDEAGPGRQTAEAAIDHMILEMNSTALPGTLDAVALAYHLPEIDSGRVTSFLSGMKRLSSKGRRPPLFLLSYSPASPDHERQILQTLAESG